MIPQNTILFLNFSQTSKTLNRGEIWYTQNRNMVYTKHFWRKFFTKIHTNFKTLQTWHFHEYSRNFWPRFKAVVIQKRFSFGTDNNNQLTTTRVLFPCPTQWPKFNGSKPLLSQILKLFRTLCLSMCWRSISASNGYSLNAVVSPKIRFFWLFSGP